MGDPDRDGNSIRLAAEWTGDFVTAVKRALGEDWSRLAQFRGGSPSEDELAALVGKKDTTGAASWKREVFASQGLRWSRLPIADRAFKRWANVDALKQKVLDAFVAELTREVVLDGGSYHIGDGAFENTVDIDVVASNSLVGEWYSISFATAVPVTAKVRIAKLYGVDHGGSVRIDDLRVGGFGPGNNRGEYLSDGVHLSAGQHTLTIASNVRSTGGDDPHLDADDLVFQRVSLLGVRSRNVTPLGKGAIAREQMQPLTENFQNPASGLAHWTRPEAEVGYTQGEYQIIAKEPHRLVAIPIEHEFLNFDLTINVRKSAGSDHNLFGIAFGVDESDTDRFVVSSDGVLPEGEANSPGHTLTSASPVREGNESNSLQLLAFGPEMALFVNGQLVSERKYSDRRVGYVWLLGGTTTGASASISFSHLNVRPLVEQPLELLGVLPGLRTKTNAKDGSEMVYVPPGKFVFGSDDIPSAQPAREIQVDGYWIYTHEVTNEQFGKFVAATGYRSEGDWRQYFAGGREKYPVVGVTWNDAVAYAGWVGVRLPTEAEWEKAARGSDRRLWAWGSVADAKKANLAELVGSAGAVGSFREDVSPYGCFDMTGNVREWTGSLFAPYSAGEFNRQSAGDSERVVRGGSWRNSLSSARVSNRDRGKPHSGDETRGFRCAMSN
jgi:formylglycine-generating enzyme required for sulfatase activity